MHQPDNLDRLLNNIVLDRLLNNIYDEMESFVFERGVKRVQHGAAFEYMC